MSPPPSRRAARTARRGRRRRSPDLGSSAPAFAPLRDESPLGPGARPCSPRPESIPRLSAAAHVTRQAVTKHLHILAGAGLVRGVRVGRDRIFAVEPARLAEARHWLDHIAGQWDQALAGLRAHVEGP